MVFIRLPCRIVKNYILKTSLIAFVIFFYAYFAIRRQAQQRVANQMCHAGSSQYEYLKNITELRIAKKLSEKYHAFHNADEEASIQDLSHGWINVSSNVFLYSAYLDKRQPIFTIHAVGAALKHTSVPLYKSFQCALKIGSSNRILYSVLKYTFVPEDHDMNYSAVIFTCQHFEADGIELHQKIKVTLISSEVTENTNWLTVHVPPETNKPNTVAVCVRPLFGPFSSVLSLSEFLAYYHVMKVDKFYFYNLSISPHVELFLKMIAQNSSIQFEVLQWDIPLSDFEIHSYGQMAQIQDCIFRTSHHFNYTIFVDLDEFLLPQTHQNIKEMLIALEAEMGPKVGGYLVSSVLYCKEFQSKVDVINDNIPLVTQMWRKRQQTAWDPPVRSKPIMKPDVVSMGGIHSIWEVKKPYREKSLSSKLALLNHYRHCCGMIQFYFVYLITFPVLSDAVVLNDQMALYENSMLKSRVFTIISELLNEKVNRGV